MNKITICIATRDGLDRFRLCMERLSVLPMISKVFIVIADNSSSESICRAKRDLIPSHLLPNITWIEVGNYDMKETENRERFIIARNKCVEHVKSNYFMLLDDDDYLTVDAIPRMLYDIDHCGKSKMIFYNVVKLGRFDIHDLRVSKISHSHEKMIHLNSFDSYHIDRFNAIYLWNCATLIDTKFFKSLDISWKYFGCDDILPITYSYLMADLVTKINYPIYYYEAQNTIQSEKSIEDIMSLEGRICQSYFEIYEKLKSTNSIDKSIWGVLSKAIHNSCRQLEVIDNYKPIDLIKLYHKVQSCIS